MAIKQVTGVDGAKIKALYNHFGTTGRFNYIEASKVVEKEVGEGISVGTLYGWELSRWVDVVVRGGKPGRRNIYTVSQLVAGQIAKQKKKRQSKIKPKKKIGRNAGLDLITVTVHMGTGGKYEIQNSGS